MAAEEITTTTVVIEQEEMTETIIIEIEYHRYLKPSGAIIQPNFNPISCQVLIYRSNALHMEPPAKYL